MTFAAARTGKSKPLPFAKSFSSSLDRVQIEIWRFPKIRGTILGVLKRGIVFWVYIGVPLFRETTI